MELLDQGTYGCIYKPGITCDAKPQSPKYTTKIHAKELQSLQGQILEVLLIIRNKEDKENHLQQEMIDSKKEGQNQLWLKLSLQKKKLKIKSKRR
jgi:hypothetical protein